MFRRSQSAKLRAALPGIIVTIVVLIGLMVVFPFTFAPAGADLLTFARWQFAISVCFHILFPSITVGTPILLCVLYGMYWNMQRPVYLQMFRFWRHVPQPGRLRHHHRRRRTRPVRRRPASPIHGPRPGDTARRAARRRIDHRPRQQHRHSRAHGHPPPTPARCVRPSHAQSAGRPPAPCAALGPKCRSTKEVTRSSALNPVPPTAALSVDRCGTARATCPGRAPRSVRHKVLNFLTTWAPVFRSGRLSPGCRVARRQPGHHLPGPTPRLLLGDPAGFPPR